MAPLEIFLDPKGPLPGIPGSRNNLYIAGDTVSGYVQVNVKTEAIKNLLIDFSGVLRVGVYNNSQCKTVQQNNSLFSFSMTPRPSAELAGKYPFCFQLPGTVVIAPDESLAPRHVPIAPQSLLPSFSYGNPTNSGWDNSGAEIKYMVTAKMEHKGAIFMKRDSETKVINISAAPLESMSLQSPTPVEHTFSLSSPRLKPGMEFYQPTAMERFSSFLGNLHQEFQDPRILVNLRADLPNSLPLGSHIPSNISINLLPESHGIDTPPRIFLTKVEAKLQIITEFAAQTVSKTKNMSMDLCSRKWDSRSMLIDYGYQNKIDITEWLSENFIHDVGNQLVPTFTTANLKRKYRIDLEIWLECVGETWKKTFERDLVLLPAFSSAPTTVVIPGSGEKSQLALNAVQTDTNFDAPPSYTES
ncbi:hypothetical protein ABW19_dt0209694 [Dactylella cylindrospora]|nr:hypothetical protein ABW19_dt0209694 [Dactylella cylindrospora]